MLLGHGHLRIVRAVAVTGRTSAAWLPKAARFFCSQVSDSPFFKLLRFGLQGHTAGLQRGAKACSQGARKGVPVSD